MTMSFLSFFTTLFCFVLIVNASPTLVARSSLDVFVPRIITPDSSTIWKVGKKGYVSWDASNAPASISNRASIKLSGYDKPLAEGFSLRDGNVTVDVPNLPFILPGKYHITLFGDSGNDSPDFAINM